jgi:hypothetical protein
MNFKREIRSQNQRGYERLSICAENIVNNKKGA